MSSQRSKWALGAGAVLIAAALAVVLMHRRQHPATPAAAPPPQDSGESLAISATPFKRWMQFEPQTQHDNLLERYYVDLMLGHQVFKMLPAGLRPQQARALLLDDDDLLLSSGRRLFNRESLARPGFVGKFCYIHSDFCLKRLYEVYFVIDGQPAVIYDNLYRIERFPSRTVTRYQLGSIHIDEHKYITWDDKAVCSYEIRSTDGVSHTVSVEVLTQDLTMPRSAGDTTYPLLGQGEYDGKPLYVYMDAPDFTLRDGYPIHLSRAVAVEGDGRSQRVNVAMSFENAPRAGTASTLPPDILERHVVDYERWFADNVPYFDSSDGMAKRMWYYRWWVVRFNMAQPDTPDLHGYSFYEGKLGFDNEISFAVPAQIEELAYLRDPRYGLDQARNAYRNLSSIGAVIDPPGSPYWGEMYSQWIGGALADFNRVHPLDAATIRELLPAMASDVRAWMKAFDPDKDFLPSRNIPRITGYDLDILSWWYFSGLKLDLFKQAAGSGTRRLRQLRLRQRPRRRRARRGGEGSGPGRRVLYAGGQHSQGGAPQACGTRRPSSSTRNARRTTTAFPSASCTGSSPSPCGWRRTIPPTWRRCASSSIRTSSGPAIRRRSPASPITRNGRGT